MFGVVVSEKHGEGLTKFFRLVVCLWIMQCCGQVFSTKDGAYRCKDFAANLSTMFTDDVRLNVLWNDPTINEDIFNVCGCCLGHRDSLSKFGILVGNDRYVPVILCCFGKRSHDFYFNKVEWCRCWEEIQFTSMAVLEAVSCATRTCAYDVAHVCSHVGPVNVAT